MHIHSISTEKVPVLSNYLKYLACALLYCLTNKVAVQHINYIYGLNQNKTKDET